MKIITRDFTDIIPITDKEFGDSAHRLIGTLEQYALTLPGNPDDIALFSHNRLYVHPELFVGIPLECPVCVSFKDNLLTLNFINAKGELVDDGCRKAKPLHIVPTSVTPYLFLAQNVERYKYCMNPKCPEDHERVLSFKQAALLIGWAFGREDEHLLCHECAETEVKKIQVLAMLFSTAVTFQPTLLSMLSERNKIRNTIYLTSHSN